MAKSGSTDGSIILTTDVDTSGLSKGIGNIKSMASASVKGFLTIGAVAGAATVAITKMAVSAYADYEQLVGGVETLFKDSAQKVIDYASDAFFTAGVSANEYMQQVTSFSASLIRSTAGDTEKAADIANMALIDISDNVNKMGSSVESVTLAYQGFAKQQYQLLDNLKLSYGGTKTEMERLLRDAQALTGVKYDINNLADVYSAIHAIQEELGITGTTAKEAEKTITGSANMMKAAWQNVLSAIAGGGDIDRAINNLVYSVKKFFENLVPIVQQSLSGIGRLIEQVGPLLVRNVASALIQAIPSLINAIYQMIVGLAQGIWDGIKALFSGESANITAELKTNVSGISTNANSAGQAISNMGKETEAAGKKAKKALASFDDLEIISSVAGDSAENIADIGNAISGGGFTTNLNDKLSNKAETDEKNTGWLSEKFSELGEALSGIQNIDTSKLTSSLERLSKPLGKLAEVAWNSILVGIKKVIVPLAKIVVENVLPAFFNGLAGALEWFGKVLEPVIPIATKFYDNFLKPIKEYANEKFTIFLGDINREMEIFQKSFEGSTAWEDWKIIVEELGRVIMSIASVVKPVIEFFIDLVAILGSTVAKTAFGAARTGLKDIEDALGLVAALIKGDFDDAWGHLRGLMIDNKVEFAQKALQDLNTEFGKLQKAVKLFQEKWNESIENMIKTWREKISSWWKNDVIPYFEEKRWTDIFFNIGKYLAMSIVNANGFIDRWTTSITQWWDNNVMPWFTHEKWYNLFNNITNGFVDAVFGKNGITETWKTSITEWWTNEILNKDWTKFETWKTFGLNMANGLIDGFKIVVNGIGGLINSVITAYEELINNVAIGYNSFATGWNSVAILAGMPTFNPIKTVNLERYKIPPLATGAVLPPNKPFMAMVGDQKHGTNIEAPAELIKQMAIEAMHEVGETSQTVIEEHYHMNETELMSIIYKLYKGGERINGNSLIKGGTY